MSKKDDKKVTDIMHSIGLKYNLIDSRIKEIVESQFRFTYNTIRTLNFDNKSPEEISEMLTNFYYKYLGKLYITPETVVSRKIREVKFKQEEDEGN